MEMLPPTIYVDCLGYCSDGTSMHDWSVARLKECIDTCWYKDISDLAKSILRKQKEEILKLNI